VNALLDQSIVDGLVVGVSLKLIYILLRSLLAGASLRVGASLQAAFVSRIFRAVQAVKILEQGRPLRFSAKHRCSATALVASTNFQLLFREFFQQRLLAKLAA